ncbi:MULTISPECIES: hypothetical protein [unclassified Deinococcus]|uniref:hypothetical protein n=1 Tax=unclassified Deinococcus TaxID=2623546 RepID=UPI001C30E07B|nr:MULTISPECIES: hypothetical protein [unclassified Deinococcus]MDK2010997.1 hypothetical protein [Deinococcus sp. 43]
MTHPTALWESSGLQRLSPPEAESIMDREATHLAASWFAPEAQPDSAQCLLADTLAHTLLGDLIRALESTWMTQESPASSELTLHHACGLETFTLLLHSPRRVLGVQVRHLLLTLLSDHEARTGVGLQTLFTSSFQPQGPGTVETLRRDAIWLGIHLAHQISRSWTTELEYQLADPRVTVLPEPRQRVLQ